MGEEARERKEGGGEAGMEMSWSLFDTCVHVSLISLLSIGFL